ncbi:MAG: creatininase family protein [Devosia nanyangense]|uniref:Creatininase family protein n=1 Tax=Devosia nanyangense TaxID=1228055 RepID=A0A933L1Q4_9HYPH|nr:creatininase family protein [Devosia nanyangense]
MIWEEMTFDAIDAVDRNVPVFLNISAIEQHGKHLPVNTDAATGAYLLDRLHRLMPSDVLILPQVKVCCSSHHLDFNGTLSVSHTTLLAYVTDMLDCVANAGFRNIVILNSHGGNQAIGQVILETLGSRHKTTRFVFGSWWRIAGEKLWALNESGPYGVGHACEFETSLMMLIAPELVREAAIEDRHYVETFEWANADLLRAPTASLYRTMKQISGGIGAIGDARAASVEKGEAIAALVTEGLAKIASDLRTPA